MKYPVYNQDKELLLRCLDSIPNRSDIEVIVCDDCSTNDTLDVLNNYTRLPLKILHNDVNRGGGYSRHQCQLAAQGKWEIELGSDDWLYTDNCNKILDTYLVNDNYDLVYYDLETDYEDDRKWMFIQREDKNSKGSTKFVNRNFAKDLYTDDSRIGYDINFHDQLMKRKPKQFFTEIVMYHFSFPREGSISTYCTTGRKEEYLNSFKKE